MSTRRHLDLLQLLTTTLGATLFAAQPQLRASPAQLVARDVVAPPADIVSGRLHLPAPETTASRSSACVFPARFEPLGDGSFAADFELVLEPGEPWSVGVLAPAAANWRVLAAPRGAALREIDELEVLERRLESADGLRAGWVFDRRELGGAPAGEWRVRVLAPNAGEVQEGWLFTRSVRAIVAEAWLDTFELVRGGDATLQARAAGPAFGALERVRVELEWGGERRELALHDDGRHGDGAARDGQFGVRVPSDVGGAVSARLEMQGRSTRGQAFQRTAHLAFVVDEPLLELMPLANAVRREGTRWALELSAAALASEPRRVLVAAEVWGTGPSGAVPVCWLARMQTPRDDGAQWRLELAFDERWLDVAQAHGPLELRNVRVQDPDSFNVLAQRAAFPLEAAELAARAPQANGPSQAALLGALVAPTTPLGALDGVLRNPALMLVHGYCSSGAIWPTAQFSAPRVEFIDPDANRTHDQFAQLIAARAASAQLSSFGVVAHSQGGPAALQLLTFYSSGLDLARGPRRIQAVASPFLGTPLASFGFLACGNNANLTPSGASAWLANIPSWARAEVSAWTTSNSGAACVGLIDFLLANPEDGTVERSRGELPGGFNLGHTLGWCHTTGMSQPANYTDAARNAQMDANAAR